MIPIGGVIQSAFTITSAAGVYTDSRKEGHGVVNSAGKAAVDFALWEVATPVMTALAFRDIASMGGQVIAGIGNNVGNTMSKQYGNSLGFYNNFNNTQNAYTMRQRGIQAIQNNGLSARNVLGSEARSYHRGNLYHG